MKTTVKNLKGHLWFIQLSLWRALVVFVAAKLILFVALGCAAYAAIFLAEARASRLLPLAYCMQHYGFSPFHWLVVQPGTPAWNGINDLAICISGIYVAWRAIRYFPTKLALSAP